jgi:SAM-dependent methyltransferase
VTDDSHRRLRTTFEEVPELYERARPRYPSQVFDDIAELGGLPSGGRILEIGCGTGQATLPLAQRAFQLTCVELGAHLAALARQKLAAFPNVEVVNSSFERWKAPAADFDAIVGFSAFHWVDPEVRYEKSAALLREGGALAILSMQHVLPDDGDEFFVDVQEDYEAVAPDDPKTLAGRPPPPDAVGDWSDEIEASGLFRNVAVRRYVWDIVYTADEYLSVIDTYSWHRALKEETRRQLYELIRRRVETRPEGKVRKTYQATLNVAKLR